MFILVFVCNFLNLNFGVLKFPEKVVEYFYFIFKVHFLFFYIQKRFLTQQKQEKPKTILKISYLHSLIFFIDLKILFLINTREPQSDDINIMILLKSIKHYLESIKHYRTHVHRIYYKFFLRSISNNIF